MNIEPIAYYRGDFVSKFGIPRQAGLVEELHGEIVFCEKYRNPDALRRIEEFSHLWLIWGFSLNERTHETLLVRPPRLGGNEKVGVFASRSPYRPNRLGLSCVALEGIDLSHRLGLCLHVSGADLADNSPIYDIKPYLAYADVKNDARCGYAEKSDDGVLDVSCPSEFEEILGNKAAGLIASLSRDPRPAYHSDTCRIYTMPFAGFEISFYVDETNTLTVTDVKAL